MGIIFLVNSEVDTVTLWRPTGPEELALVEGSGWRRSEQAIRAAEQGLVEAAGAPALTLDIERELLFPLNVAGDISGSGAHAARVIELSEALGDEAGLTQGLGVAALSEFMLGRGVNRAAIARVMAVDPAVGGAALLDARGLLSHVLAWTGDVAAARDSLEQVRQRLVDDGDEASLAGILFRAALIEIPAGDWSLAAQRAQQGEDICRRTGQDVFLSGILSVRSSIHTFRGQLDDARACAEQGIASGAATGAMLGVGFNMAALGFLASSRRDSAGTHEHLGPLVAAMRGAGVEEPASMWWLADEIEALVALGDNEQAAALTGWLDDGARGVWEVKRAGGRVLAQDPSSAECPEMPRWSATICQGSSA